MEVGNEERLEGEGEVTGGGGNGGGGDKRGDDHDD